jgi:hypothetical protein
MKKVFKGKVDYLLDRIGAEGGFIVDLSRGSHKLFWKQHCKYS